MSKLTFKSRISWWFAFILATFLTLITVVFAFFYAGFTLVNRQNFMLREAGEIFEKHMVVINSEIFFRRDDKNKTLSAYLRDEGLSALILDINRKVVGTYGVYASLVDENNVERVAKKVDLDKVFLEGQTPFGFYQLYENRTHLVLFYPVISENEIIGTIVLGSDLNIGPSTIVLSIGILIFILMVSIAFGWLFTYLMVTRQFRPLQRILNQMNDYEFGQIPDEYELNGNPKDELIRLSKAFKQMIERINEGSAKQTEFISNASHELKTPLANSLLTLDLAEMDLLDAKYEEAKVSIRTVKGDLKRYGELINGLLEIAKIDESKVRSKTVNLSGLINELLSQHKDNITKNIKVNIDKKVNMTFPENHLRIILNNLIGNAIKYSKKNGKIMVSIKDIGGGEIVVENETTYLKSKDLGRIWKRNERLVAIKRIVGNGIGLYLVKEVADHYGLTIDQSLKDEVYSVTVRGF